MLESGVPERLRFLPRMPLDSADEAAVVPIGRFERFAGRRAERLRLRQVVDEWFSRGGVSMLTKPRPSNRDWDGSMLSWRRNEKRRIKGKRLSRPIGNEAMLGPKLL